MAFKVPEKYRIRNGRMATDPSYGNNGAFFVRTNQIVLKVIASDGNGWEHVSVSLSDRCPTWKEMNIIKDLFWEPEDCVIQYHPPQSEYINCHPYCLHLWRPIDKTIPIPPTWMVGPQS